MSDPKVPSWMKPYNDRAKLGHSLWISRGTRTASYLQGDCSATLFGDFNAEELRELADLIDSCQEGYNPDQIA